MSNNTGAYNSTTPNVRGSESNSTGFALLYFVYNGPEDAWFFVLHGIECLIGIVANSLVILVFMQKKLRSTAHNVYLANLSAAELLMCVCLIIKILNELMPLTQSPYICVAYYLVFTPSGFAQVLTHVMVAMERLVAVKWPLKFKKFTSKRNVSIQIGLLWLFSVIEGVLPVYSVMMDLKSQGRCMSPFGSASIPAMRMYIALVYLFIPCSVTAFLYVPVLWKIWARRHVNPTTTPLPRVTDSQQKALSERLRSIRIFFCTYFLYVLCYLPMSILTICRASLASTDIPVWMENLFRVAYLVLYAPLFLNPMVHILVNRNFISGFKKLVRVKNNPEQSITLVTVLSSSRHPNHINGTPSAPNLTSQRLRCVANTGTEGISARIRTDLMS